MSGRLTQRHEPEPGLTVLEAGQQQLCPSVQAVGPRYSEWLPQVLDALLPACESAVRALADDHDAVIDGGRVFPSTFPRDVLVEEHGIDANNEGYANSIVEWTAKWAQRRDVDDDDISDSAPKLREWCHECVTEVGTGQAPEGMDLDGLRAGPLRLVATRERSPAVVLFLDGEAWTSLDDTRTGERALDVLDELADVVDVRLVVSPRLRHHLSRSYPEWADANLTEPGDTSGAEEAASADAAEERARAYDILDQWGGQTGRVRLLAGIPADGSRTSAELTSDPEVDVAEGSLYAYLGDLEAEGMIDVDRRSRPHSVSLTRFGEVAQSLVLPSYHLNDPAQQDLTTSLTQPVQPSTGTVSRANRSREGGEDGPPPQPAEALPTPEEWLCATDPPDDEACSGFVQWLNGGRDLPKLNAYALHKRLLAGRRTEGVTCVDERLGWFDHGRVAYLSCLESEVQLVTQWGGSAATLGRIAAALSSSKVWGQILTEEQLGPDLGKIDGAGGVSKDEFVDYLQRGHQIGWSFHVDADRLDYRSLRNRLHNVGRGVLADIETMRNGDATQKSELYSRALGLLTCMTKLMDAVGLDITIHVRVPDVDQLRRDPARLSDFTQFFAKTAPKQATYGVHSAWRQVGETREDKLRFRLPMDVQEEATADLTASWVVAGPGADELQDDLAGALEEVEIRERVEEGREENIAISIPVMSGNSYAAIKSLVDDHFTRKGFFVESEDLRRLTRVLIGLLGTEAWHCSPFSAAEALLACAHGEGYSLTVGDVAHALSTLSADRLVPNASSGTQRMLKALLASDEPLGKDALIDQADVSEATYYRRIEDLRALAIVERDEGGVWRVFIEPWWAAEAKTDEPYLEATEAMRTAWTTEFPEDLSYEMALRRGCESLNKIQWADPSLSLSDVGEALSWLNPWIPWIRALLEEPPNNRDPRDRNAVVHLGHPSVAQDRRQTTLSAMGTLP